jgi:hypothetical protein
MTKDGTAKTALPTTECANVEALVIRYRRAGVALAVQGRRSSACRALLFAWRQLGSEEVRMWQCGPRRSILCLLPHEGIRANITGTR